MLGKCINFGVISTRGLILVSFSGCLTLITCFPDVPLLCIVANTLLLRMWLGSNEKIDHRTQHNG